jgi:SET domain-containing protein
MTRNSRISASVRRGRDAHIKLPHDGVYTRITCSRIHGVGVKAIRRIRKGILIFPDDNEPIIWIEADKLKRLSKTLRRLYSDFCIIQDGGKTYGCPKSFNRLTVAWYLNRPKAGAKPNVGCREDYTFYALRDIKPGEELTVDYRTFSETPTS